MEIPFPHENILPRNEIPRHPPSKKKSLKTSVYLPITNAKRKQWAKFTIYSFFSGGYGRLSRLQRHSYQIFRLSSTK